MLLDTGEVSVKPYPSITGISAAANIRANRGCKAALPETIKIATQTFFPFAKNKFASNFELKLIPKPFYRKVHNAILNLLPKRINSFDAC
jgi:hypothetical protein